MSDTIQEELADLKATFDLRYKADMRAIALWRKNHPERELIQPDHADLVVWLLEQIDKKDQEFEILVEMCGELSAMVLAAEQIMDG